MNISSGPFRKFQALALIWFLTGTLGIYLRLYPVTHYISPQAYDKGAILAINALQKKVREDIDAHYPFLPADERKRLSKTAFDKIVHQDRDQFRRAIDQTALKVQKTLSPERTCPYLLASDSYYYYGLTRDILETGSLSDQIQGSKYFHKLMEAPLGHWEPLNLHPYVGYGIYRVVKFFNPGVELMSAVSVTPLVMVALCLVPFLVICAVLRFSYLAMSVGAVNFLTTVAFFERSLYGWYDNDPYNIFFPLSILGCMFYGIKHMGEAKKLFRSAVLCSFLLPLYALFWQGWVFLQGMLALFGLCVIILNHFVFKDKAQTPKLILFFLISLGGAFFGIGLIFGFAEFFNLFNEGWVALIGFTKASVSLWPDLYIAVGELLKTTPVTLIELTGGYAAFAVSLTGAGVTAWKFSQRRSGSDDLPALRLVSYFVLVNVLFFLISAYLALGAKRFVFLAQIPLILLFPLGLHYIFEAIQALAVRLIGQAHGKTLGRALGLGLAIVLMAVPVKDITLKTPGLLRTIFNDVWEKALVKIEKETPKNAIVNTWWPPGHFIKTFSRRRVTFDGATINAPQSYWLANVLISSDERQALGLLRMLNNSANKAVDFLTSRGWKLSTSVALLKKIAPLNRAQALEELKTRLAPGPCQELLALTHAVPPPSYLLIYNDLIEKNIQLTYVGKWDFSKIEQLSLNPLLLKAMPKAKSAEYVDFIWRISGGQTRYSGELLPVKESSERIVFDGGIEVDLTDMSCRINSEKFGRGVPDSIIYLQGDRVVEKKFPAPHFNYSVLVAQQRGKGGYVCVLADQDLAESLLLRLYYFQGRGLKYLKPFCYETNLTRRTEILVYEVDWGKFLADLDAYER